jgi:transposase
VLPTPLAIFQSDIRAWAATGPQQGREGSRCGSRTRSPVCHDHIPSQNNVRGRSVVDLKIYRHRNLVERFFNKLKYFRRIAARCNNLAAATLASVKLWMRHI